MPILKVEHHQQISCPKCGATARIELQSLDGKTIADVHCSMCGFLKPLEKVLDPSYQMGVEKIKLPREGTLFWKILVYLYDGPSDTQSMLKKIGVKSNVLAYGLSNLKKKNLVVKQKINGVDTWKIKNQSVYNEVSKVVF